MEKAKINYFLDVLLGISFLITAITGLIIFLFLPSGVRFGRYQTFLGVSKSSISFLHDVFGLAMIVIAIIHIILHLKFYVVMTKNIFKIKRDK